MNGEIANIGSLMSSWFSPTVLFCLLNLVIATIFLSSNLKSPNKNPPQNQNQNHSDDYNTHNSPQLDRAPSLLQRVRSFNFSLYGSDSSNPFQPETHATETHATENPVQTQPARAPSILERVRSNNLSLHRSDSLDPSETVNPVQTQLARAPSILERVKSFNFSLFGYDHPDPNHHTKHDNDPGHDHHAMRSKSDTTGEGERHVAEVRMKKSVSERRMAEEAEEEEDEERRRPATVRERKQTSFFGEDEKVDEKADDFINRFKQQLKLQRLDSFTRYKEMLTRGSGR